MIGIQDWALSWMLLEVLNTYMVYHMRVLFIEILNHPIFFSEMTYGLKLRVLDWFVLLLQNICWLLILAVTEVCNTFWSWEYHLSREMVQNNAYKAGKTSNGSWWNNWVHEETLASVSIAAELAEHCCASRLCQRPDMGKVVNVLSSLAELRKPQQHT